MSGALSSFVALLGARSVAHKKKLLYQEATLNKPMHSLTLGAMLVGRFYAQICQFWKSACISEAAARRVKISSFFYPKGLETEREYMCNFLQLFCKWPSIMRNYGSLKMYIYLGNCCRYSRNRLKFTPCGGKRVYFARLATFANGDVPCQITYLSISLYLGIFSP